MLGRIRDMFGTAQGNPFRRPSGFRLGAGVRDLLLSSGSQRGAIGTVTLVIMLVAPLIVIGAVAFVLIVAYLNRVARVTGELEAKKKPPTCPACGHKLIEIRNFCAECGASIRPPEPEQPQEPDTVPEEPM